MSEDERDVALQAYEERTGKAGIRVSFVIGKEDWSRFTHWAGGFSNQWDELRKLITEASA